MKPFGIAFAALIFAPLAQAATPSCPSGSNPVLTCVEATQKEDQMLASGFMKGAVVCESEGSYQMIMELNEGGQSPAVPMQKEARVGATTYSYQEDNTAFSISRMMVSPSAPANAKFSITVEGGITSSRSLKCN